MGVWYNRKNYVFLESDDANMAEQRYQRNRSGKPGEHKNDRPNKNFRKDDRPFQKEGKPFRKEEKPFRKEYKPFEKEERPQREARPKPQPEPSPALEQEDLELVCGRNAVTELIRSEKSVDCIYIVNDNENAKRGPLAKIFAMAKDKKLVIREVSTAKLDEICGGVYHQGVAAKCSAVEYASVEEILAYANAKNEDPFIIIADCIEDPHNLGAIIRTAEACGAHGIIIPKRRSASVNATVYRTSAGAAGVMRIAKVTNLVSEMKELKEKGVWFYCADMDGEPYDKTNFKGGVGLVIGAEGEGVSRLVKETCDVCISLPMCGQINSLNASVAAGVLMYEVLRGRRKA